MCSCIPLSSEIVISVFSYPHSLLKQLATLSQQTSSMPVLTNVWELLSHEVLRLYYNLRSSESSYLFSAFFMCLLRAMIVWDLNCLQSYSDIFYPSIITEKSFLLRGFQLPWLQPWKAWWWLILKEIWSYIHSIWVFTQSSYSLHSHCPSSYLTTTSLIFHWWPNFMTTFFKFWVSFQAIFKISPAFLFHSLASGYKKMSFKTIVSLVSFKSLI